MSTLYIAFSGMLQWYECHIILRIPNFILFIMLYINVSATGLYQTTNLHNITVTWFLDLSTYSSIGKWQMSENITYMKENITKNLKPFQKLVLVTFISIGSSNFKAIYTIMPQI